MSLLIISAIIMMVIMLISLMVAIMKDNIMLTLIGAVVTLGFIFATAMTFAALSTTSVEINRIELDSSMSDINYDIELCEDCRESYVREEIVTEELWIIKDVRVTYTLMVAYKLYYDIVY